MNGGRASIPAMLSRCHALVALCFIAVGQYACMAQIGDSSSAPTGSDEPTPSPGDPNPSDDDPNDPGPNDTDLRTGLEHWNAQCASCHGAFSGSSAISAGNANGDFRLDAEAAIARHGQDLETYINDTMPFQAAASCQGECATLTGAYIRSRRPLDLNVDCTGAEALTYGVREMKLLTSREYQRALEDLLGVGSDFAASVANGDGAVGGFPNNRGKGLASATLERYVGNAETIAAWAVANGRPFTCADPNACAQRFVDEFLYRAFRGPVSAEQRTAFSQLFDTYGAEGLQLALEAALTSPYFLYRVEAGVDLQTAIDRGYYTNTSNEAPAGNAEEVIAATAFPGGSGRLEGNEWAFVENGGLNLTFTTAFTDPTVLEVQARGSNHGNIWPELTVRVNGNVVGTETVDQTTVTTFRFTVNGQSGSPSVRIEFNNDSGVAPYGPGMDANLYITSVGVATTSAIPTPDPVTDPNAENPLDGVDPTAYVLTPYELASALSFMLVGSIPDPALLDAARDDRLTTRDQIRAQVIRLIDSERGRQHVGTFVSDWFGLEKVKQASRPDVPEFSAAVKNAMVDEVRAHFAHVFYDDAVPYSDFFGGNYTFLNDTLASYYGIPGSFGDAFVKTDVVGRGGPIASGAFMAANAHVERTAPILRAVHARQSALCHYIDPPNSPLAGDDIDAERAAAQMRVSEREQEEGLLSSRDFYYLYTDGIQACAGCHERIINPMFGMEDFDNVGRLRPTAGANAVMETIGETQKQVSLEGTLFGVSSTSDTESIAFAGAKDFSNKIAQTDAVKTCLIRKSFRFLTGLPFSDRDLDTASRETLSDEQRTAYSCVASRMADALNTSGDSPRTMFIELATETLLRLRR